MISFIRNLFILLVLCLILLAIFNKAKSAPKESYSDGKLLNTLKRNTENIIGMSLFYYPTKTKKSR